MNNVNFYSGNIKSKIKTRLTFLSSATILALAVVFVFVYWGFLNGLDEPNFNPAAILNEPRSDEPSETFEEGFDPAVSHDPTATLNPNDDYNPNPNFDDVNSGGTPVKPQTPINPDEINPSKPIEVSDMPNAPGIILSQEIVRFKPDEAVFLNPEAAETVLAEYANKLRDIINNGNSDVKVYIIGSVADARDSNDAAVANSHELSEKRSLAVLEAFIRHGVPEKFMFALGMSCNDPWHLDNYDENDMFIEEIAALNRKVVIVASGDDAMDALNAQIISDNSAFTVFYYNNGVLVEEQFDTLR